ncbi:GTPase [Jeotgalibacillus sp. S-D1]|uniref:GTPase n=1 Tax=Jeotgalibacillus sp. S-D1 TaxID=2552189 RepID=UPI0026AAFE7C|nr:GTPase [Jeotgalibacillus sp. S-D1]
MTENNHGNYKEFDHWYEEEMKKVNQQLDQEILIAMIGDVNAGKSSTINKLIGDTVAEVGAKPGETKDVKRYQYNGKIFFVDTPGLDDIIKEHSGETLKFYKQADVVLFFLNAAGTVLSDGELKSLKELEGINKNIVIVLNKIDAAEDIPALVDYIKKHTKNKHQIVPISSKTGENMDQLRNKLLDLLKKKKKDILFAKNIKAKSSTAKKWIFAASGSAATVGASPLPGSDIIPITAIQVGLMVKLATLYDKPLSKERAKELAIATVAGNVGKSVFRQIVKTFPGVGSVAGAGVAGAMTFSLGQAMKYAYENNIDLDVEALRSIYDLFMKRYPSLVGKND